MKRRAKNIKLYQKTMMDAGDLDDQYVSADEIKDLMWGYLYLDKQHSQRSLAKSVLKDLKKEKVKISLESIQRIFGKDAKKAHIALKEVFLEYYKKFDLKKEKEIKNHIKKVKAKAIDEFSLIESTEVIKLATLWNSVNPGKSKRVLAKQILEELTKQGYKYHLGSLQNILSGKIAQTKKIVYLILQSILVTEFYGTTKKLNEALENLDDQSLEQFKMVPADLLVKKTDEFLQLYPHWTKRKLAIQLTHDLKKQGYSLSFNTLQYSLAGKRNTVKKIIETTFLSYFENAPKWNDEVAKSIGDQKSTYIPKKNLKKIYSLLNSDNENLDKEKIKENYLSARSEELKRLWEKRKNKTIKKSSSSLKNRKSHSNVPSPELIGQMN